MAAKLHTSERNAV